MWKRALLLTTLAISLVSWGCASSQEDKQARTFGKNTGAIRFSIGSDVERIIGFRFELYQSMTDETRLEGQPEVRDPVATAVKMLDVKKFPVEFRGMIRGPFHGFSDSFFILPRGKYDVIATPLEGEASRMSDSEICPPVRQDGVEVQSNVTSEILLVSNCGAERTGALDVGILVNVPPIFTRVDYAPSKFIAVDEEVRITLYSEDSDRDVLTYKWEILNPVEGITSNDEGNGSFTFRATTAGEYQIKVTACDQDMQCSDLTLPLHVGVYADQTQPEAQPGETSPRLEPQPEDSQPVQTLPDKDSQQDEPQAD